MQPNRQYFIVNIDKDEQAVKREKIVLGGTGYLGCKYSDQGYQGKGVMITGVEPGSPAQAAGFKAKDIIRAIGKTEVNSFDELADEVSKYFPGDEIEILSINSLLVNGAPQIKKVKLGQKNIDLENPAHLRDMRHNLQFGEIVACGPDAANDFPHAKVGDTLIFHHSVEYKARSEGDTLYNDVHLVGHDDKGNELRLVNYEFEVLGVMKWKRGTPHIIPYPKFVFCHMQIRKASIQKDPETGLYMADQWEKSMQENTERIEELAAQMEQVASSTIMKQKTSDQNYRRKEEISAVLNVLMQEKKDITRKMHQKKLVEVTVLYFNPKSKDQLGYSLTAGDKVIADYYSLYPLDIQGVCFSLARVGTIEGAIFKNQLPYKKLKSKKTVMSATDNKFFNPLHDRVVLKMHEAEVITESGLIIPDVAQQIPGCAEIVACGPGTTEKPMQAKVGDIILLSKYAGQDIEFGGKVFRFIREEEILTTLKADEARKAVEQNEKVIAAKEKLKTDQDLRAKDQLGNEKELTGKEKEAVS
jgi:chaperonin GroES